MLPSVVENAVKYFTYNGFLFHIHKNSWKLNNLMNESIWVTVFDTSGLKVNNNKIIKRCALDAIPEIGSSKFLAFVIALQSLLQHIFTSPDDKQYDLRE